MNSPLPGQTCLDLSAARLTTCHDLSESAVGEPAVRRTELTVVEHIQCIEAQLERYAFPERLSSRQPHIPLPICRTTQIRLDPVTGAHSKRSWNSIGSRIEPVFGILSTF